jgi:uncharacterized protein with ATP-grasp and redox domains
VKIHDRCYGCLLGRIAYESRLSTADEGRIAHVLSECNTLLGGFRGVPRPASLVASAAHRRAYELLGDPDPYRRVKEASTEEAIRACRVIRLLATDRTSSGVRSGFSRTIPFCPGLPEG